MINFWKTTDEYGFLSNFSHHPIIVNGKTYKSCEHYYQAMKTTNEDDHELVRTAQSSKKSKEIAYTLEMRPDWEEIKYDVMKTALRNKANQWDFIKRRLIETGDTPLAENSPKDAIWGLGADGNGKNLLGKAWMDIRAEIQTKISVNDGSKN